MGWLYYLHIRHKRTTDLSYNIVAIVQTGPVKEGLNFIYLSELLDLSVDRPRNLYQFNTSEARRRLLASPLIKTAEVKKILPGTVYVDYTVRQPVAFLADYQNAAIDEEGYLFPFQPFFTPKKLPEFYLGLSEGEVDWGQRLEGRSLSLAFDVYHLLKDAYHLPISQIKKIDVAKAFVTSLGERQIVVTVEDTQEVEKGGSSFLVMQMRLLRLNSHSYQEALKNYAVLRDYLIEEERKSLETSTPSQAVTQRPPMVIDLRIPKLAFFQK